MFVIMKRVSDDTLQPIGIEYNEECKYIPTFPEVSDAIAWIKDTGFPWTCISNVGFKYETGCIVAYHKGEEPDGFVTGEVEVVE